MFLMENNGESHPITSIKTLKRKLLLKTSQFGDLHIDLIHPLQTRHGPHPGDGVVAGDVVVAGDGTHGSRDWRERVVMTVEDHRRR